MPKPPFRVLLVNNNRAVEDIVKESLHRSPHLHLVGECHSGKEGTHAVAQHHPHLVLLFSPLPDKSAELFIAKARRIAPPPRIILIANRPEMIGFATARRKASDGFISLRLLKIELPMVLTRLQELLPAWGERFSPWKEEYGLA